VLKKSHGFAPFSTFFVALFHIFDTSMSDNGFTLARSYAWKERLLPMRGGTEMEVRRRAALADCPDCGESISVGFGARQGQRLTCANCGAYLEVINLGPLELDWAFSEFEPDLSPDDEEEWGDEEWDDEEWDEEEGSANGKGMDYWEP
jgi:predicted RNA-binding Zn-ribbon protein involved in translation (DUF1610 family)